MSKKAAFFTLLGLVYDELPRKEFVNKMVLSNPNLNAGRLALVREGKTPDLEILIESVEVLLPDFKIPEKILSLK
jgi:hypothetical protein